MTGADLACRVLLRLGCALPVDPTAILGRCPQVRVRPYRDVPGLTARGRAGLEASTLADPEGTGRYLVLYEDRGDPLRLRYTLAHELGHVLLRHAEQPERPEAEKEAEADRFASHLLVPRAALCLWAGRTAELCAEQAAAACHVTVGCALRALRGRELPDASLLRETEALLAGTLPALRPVPEGQRLSRHWLTANELEYWRNHGAD